jgi:hypothetical protein|tara:strand:+ start:1415 stop:1651 length:237 start_codon:yes stop_codon:yes gene_type:complete
MVKRKKTTRSHPLKYRLTSKIGKKKKVLGTFNKPSSVDKILKKAKELKKTFPFKEKAYVIIQPIRNHKKSGKAIIKGV